MGTIKFNFKMGGLYFKKLTLTFVRKNNNLESFFYSQSKLNFPKSKNDALDLKNYEQETLLFCNQWQEGIKEFNLKTSGSTGIPKEMKISREQMKLSAAKTIQLIGLKQGDKALVCLNTKYIAGIMMLVSGFEAAMEMSIIAPTANPLEQFPSDTYFDFASFVPYQLQSILEDTPEKIPILNRMKGILLGGAAISPYLEERIQALSVPVYATFGMTETISHIACRRMNGASASHKYTCMPGIEINTNAKGCLTIKGDVTNFKLIETNDLVEINPPNQFYWIGRTDNVINSGGIKIPVEKLENKISEAFMELKINNRFFITGLPDTEFGQVVALFVEGTLPEGTKSKIVLLLKQKITRYEIPKRIIEIVKFEETPTGKIDRIKTKPEYQ